MTLDHVMKKDVKIHQIEDIEKMNEEDNENPIPDLFLQILKEEYGEEFELESEPDKDFSPYIICDKRERRSNIAEELENLGANVIEVVLDAGDYLLSSEVGVERKRGDDFYGSLFSGSNQTNIFEELIRLTESVGTPMLILEDMNRMFKRGEDMNSSLYGALVSIATKLGIPIIPTRNSTDTALVLFRIAKQQQGAQTYHGIARRAPKSMTLKDRQKFFIEGFFNVGPTKADTIINEFKTPMMFIEALKNTNILYTKTGNPKGVDGPLKKLKGFGWKFVKANKSLLEDLEDLDMS